MTQALNLALLANKVNTSGQLDGPTGITGAVPTATTSTNLAGGTQGQAAVQSAAGTTTFVDSSFAFKNRIINGAMVIDQRNAGASVTPTNGQYLVDRWSYGTSQASKFTAQQSTTAPVGFKNSLLFTSSSAFTPASGDLIFLSQNIEGYNIADLAWGTASASTVTLSFWVRSSVTGTFSGAINNNSFNRSYPFTFTVNSANTFEQKSITISGDTTGTWATDNTGGVLVRFSLGTGSTYLGTANTWAGAGYIGATGSTQPSSTNGATFYITGVQLEKGSTATSFDYRPYGTELALCQRYYEIIGDVVGGTTPQAFFGDSYTSGGSTAQVNWIYRQQKRAAPTVATYGTYTFVNATTVIFTGNNSTLGVCVLVQPTSATAQRSFFYPNAASGVYSSAEL